jgi:hypothetical protein
VAKIRYVLKLLLVSLLFIGIATVLGLIFGLIMHASFTLRYIFGANLAMGVIAITAGFFYMFFPSSMLQRGDKLFDHTTFAERSFKARRRRQKLAVEMSLVGIFTIVTSGLVQIFLSLIL